MGDDAAFLPGGSMAVTVDQQIQGVHFPEGLTPVTIGRRLVRVNVSDVSAIGGQPSFGFLALAAPPEYPVEELLFSVEDALASHGARLAGGDLAVSDRLTAGLTLLARRQPRGRWLMRSTAAAGDRLWLGGTVGTSALGCVLLQRGATFDGRRVSLPPTLGTRSAAAARRAVVRHLRPPDQLELGAWLSRRRRVAAIDVSDGLLLDLDRLCRASGVGALVEAARLPLDTGFSACASRIGIDPLDLALTGGEDYVLLFTLPSKIRPPKKFNAIPIGEIRSTPGLDLRGAPIPHRLGWDHFGHRG